MRSSIFPMISVLLLFVSCTPRPPFQLDGIIEPDEWKGSEEFELTGGGRLLLVSEENVLYAAVVAEEKIWAHFYGSDGEQVKVMHASAALDAVEYYPENDLWRTADEFNFEMRESAYTDEVRTRMEDYYQQNGWVANTVNMGSGQVVEFKLDLGRWKGPTFYFACVTADYDLKLSFFPTTLTDDTILEELVQGYTPDSLEFIPSNWHLLNLDQ